MNRENGSDHWVFVSAPLTAKTHYLWRRNLQNAERLGAEVAAAGWIPIVPHNLWGCYFGLIPEALAWPELYRLLGECSAMLYSPTYLHLSHGCRREYEYAQQQGIPCVEQVIDLGEVLA